MNMTTNSKDITILSKKNFLFLRPSHYGCGKTVTLGFYSDELHSNQLTNETVREILKNAIKDYRNTIKELSLH